MGIENCGVLGPQGEVDLALHFQNLAASVDQGLFQTVEFMGDIRFRNLMFCNLVLVRSAQNKNLSATNSRRDRDAADDLFSGSSSF